MQCHTNQWGVANELEDRIMPKSVASATDALQKRGQMVVADVGADG